MIYDRWSKRWKNTLASIEKIGGETEELIISDKASIEDIKKVETLIENELPHSFKKVLTQFASSVYFSWSLPDNFNLPTQLKGIFCGECIWSLDKLSSIVDSQKSWVKECFSNPNDEYDKVWHNKLAFIEVVNGDFISFDLEYMPDPPVVYLSHDGDISNGYILGDNFFDFIDKWTMLGCVGTEDWQMEPFIDSPTSGLNAYCDNAFKWRALIDLEI